MVSCMKTTLNLDDRVLVRAKRLAASEGLTLTALVEEALRARIAPKQKGRRAFRLTVPIVTGKAPPRVDIADRSALFDLLDEEP